MDADLLRLATIPLIAGAIGYATNWLAVKMLFFPLRFVGVRVPLVRAIAAYLPRRVQQIPGIAQGGIGWQGIIPSRAAKMGSIAVDKGIAKLGSPADFYRQLDPEAIAEQIVASARPELRGLVEEIMRREHPALWQDLPPRVREAVHRRVQENLPDVVRDVTDDIGENVDQLLDVKLMVIRHIERNPELANRIFLEVGEQELRFIVRSGAYFGALLGLPLIAAFQIVDSWLVLPLGGALVGYATNWLALKIIFEPEEPRTVGPFVLHGLFLRRQPEVAVTYSRIIADHVVTLANMGRELLEGPRADRTRRMIERRLRPAVDRAAGIARPAVRLMVGTREYDAIRDSLAAESVTYTMTPLVDPEFNRRQSDRVRDLICTRMRELPPKDFAELLRSAMREDEWLLILVGAQLGFVAGWLQVGLVFGGA